MTQNRTRTFTLDRAKAQGDVFPAVATTETPVKRSFGYEVLDMSRMDLSRAPLPVIESHDQSKLNIGLFEDVRVEDDKLRGSIRLGKSARAKEVAEDIRGGIIRSVSVGYEAYDPIESGEIDGTPVYRFAATIHELSLVAAPADINSGIYRSKGTMTMEHSEIKDPKAESVRIKQIEGMADEYDLPEIGMRSIANGDSVQEFNRKALAAIEERNARARRDTKNAPADDMQRHQPNHYLGAERSIDPNRYGELMGRYSLLKLLRGLSDPRKLSEAGLELEVSKDMQQVLGRSSKGIMVPFEALQQSRAVTIGGTGSNLVATDHLAGSFIDILRNSSRVMQLGPRVLRGLVGDVAIPRKTSGATGYWIAGDNSDGLTESDIALDQLGLTPKTVGGAVTFSHKMIVQSSPDIEDLVRQDLADMIASEIDVKALQGSGASNQPLGILNTTGIGSIDFTADDPTYPEVVQMETALANANADSGNLAWLMNPAMAEALKTTPKQGSGVEGNFIWGDGRICNAPAYRTANIPAGYMLLGNWQHLLMGFWGGIEIDADPYGSNFLKGSITVRVLADIDMGVRHAGAFCEGHNAA